MDISGQRRNISLDRLKPAFVEPKPDSQVESPDHPVADPSRASMPTSATTSTVPPTLEPHIPLRTRSGRCVHWPKALEDYVP